MSQREKDKWNRVAEESKKNAVAHTSVPVSMSPEDFTKPPFPFPFSDGRYAIGINSPEVTHTADNIGSLKTKWDARAGCIVQNTDAPAHEPEHFCADKVG